MRVIVLGGTRFVGRALVARLVGDGHDVLVVHRGVTEPEGLAAVAHLHAARAEWPRHADELAGFRPDAAVDVSGGNGEGAAQALAALPSGIRLVALSSVDVYRAYESLHRGRHTDDVPLTEDAALREERFMDGPDWENLELEAAYRPAGGIILRLGAVYGEHDYQRRFDLVLRRVRAGRTAMPVGAGTFLFSRVYVGDVATAVCAALASTDVEGQCFNVVEERTAPMRQHLEAVVAAAGATLELRQVDDDLVPADLRVTTALSQDLLVDAGKAGRLLGWREGDPGGSLARSVRWHLANPPLEESSDFSGDDLALAARRAP